MTNILPKIIHPFRMARSNSKLTGTLPVKDLLRIKDLLLNDAGDAQLALNFTLDETGQVIFSGHINCKLVLQCQRCLEPMDYLHDASFQLAPMIVTGHSIENDKIISSGLEPLLLDEDALDIIQLTEDEILLALPIIPRHENLDCNKLFQEQAKKSFEKVNPFSKILGCKILVGEVSAKKPKK